MLPILLLFDGFRRVLSNDFNSVNEFTKNAKTWWDELSSRELSPLSDHLSEN